MIFIHTQNKSTESHSVGMAPVFLEEVEGGGVGLVGSLGPTDAIGVWDMFLGVEGEKRSVLNTVTATASTVVTPVCSMEEKFVS